MKIYIFVFCFFYNANVMANLFTKRHDFPLSDDYDRSSPVINSIKMRVNHFSWFDRSTFDLRYSTNGEFFNGTGPMFVYIGGESSLEDQLGSLYSGLLYDMAKELGGYMFIPEHRYYGQSVPNKNLHTFNLRHLTFAQVLADLSYFIKDRKKNTPGLQLKKVVVVGGSYAGTLAAWMRLKYPDVVDAAYSSSGVFKIKADNYEYDEIVLKSLANNCNKCSNACISTIKNGIKQTKVLLQTKDGVNNVTRDFGLCETLKVEDKKEVQNFFSSIQNVINNIVQYNNQGVYINVTTMCETLLYNSTIMNEYSRLAAFIIDWNSAYNNNECISSYQSSIKYLRSTESSDSRQWTYQTCTEFGSFITTDSNNQPFTNTVPLSYWYHVCDDIFGIRSFKTNLGIAHTNLIYGGTNLKVTKVVFTVGTLDPWSGLGLKKNLNELAPVISINGTSHCADLGNTKRSDPVDLTNARKKVKEHIYSWIN